MLLNQEEVTKRPQEGAQEYSQDNRHGTTSLSANAPLEPSISSPYSYLRSARADWSTARGN